VQPVFRIARQNDRRPGLDPLPICSCLQNWIPDLVIAPVVNVEVWCGLCVKLYACRGLLIGLKQTHAFKLT